MRSLVRLCLICSTLVIGIGMTASAHEPPPDVSQAVQQTTSQATQNATAEPTADSTPVEASFAGTFGIDLPVQGTLGRAVFRQTWLFTGVAGQVIDLSTARTSGDLDTYVALLSAQGDVLAANDNPVGGGPDAQISAFTLPYNGDYTVAVRRAGSENGRLGSTSGTYTLTLRVRGGSDPATFSGLQLEQPILGRWTGDQPTAIYRLLPDGDTRFVLDTESPDRLVRIQVTDQNGGVYLRREGVAPLIVETDLPPNRTLYITASPIDPDAGNARFSLSAYRGSTRPQRFRVARFGQTLPGTTADTTAWHFTARRGDYYRIVAERITNLGGTVAPTAGLRLILRDSREGVVAQGSLYSVCFTYPISVTGLQCAGSGDPRRPQTVYRPGYDEALYILIPQDNLYQLTVAAPEQTPGSLPFDYRVRIDRIGANGVLFDTLLSGVDQGALPIEGLAGSLTQNAAVHRYYFDSAGDESFTFRADTPESTAAFALAIISPNGSVLSGISGSAFGGVRLDRVDLVEPGRYQVVIYARDPDTADNPALITVPVLTVAANYTLTLVQVADVRIDPDTGIGNGAVTATSRDSRYVFAAPSASLINLRLQNFSRANFSPSITLLDPDGYAIAQAGSPESEADGDLLLNGVRSTTSGFYTVQVSGTLTGTFAEFRLFEQILPEPGEQLQPLSFLQPEPVEQTQVVPAIGGVRVPLVSEDRTALYVSAPIPVEFARERPRGTLSAGRDVRGELVGDSPHGWRFSASAGTIFRLTATTFQTSTVFDELYSPRIAVLAPDGTILTESGANGSAVNTLSFRAGRGGTFIAVVTLSGGKIDQRKRYTLNLSPIPDRTETPIPVEGLPITIGESVGGQLLGPEDSASFYFTGRTGQVLDVAAGSVVNSTPGRLRLTVLTQGGTRIASAVDRIQGVRLTADGLYRVQITPVSPDDPRTVFTVSIMHAVSEVIEPTLDAVLTLDSILTLALNRANPRHDLLIALQAGVPYRIGIGGVDNNLPSGARLRLEDSRGLIIDSITPTALDTAFGLDHVVVPRTGIYRVVVTGGDTESGIVLVEASAVEPPIYLHYGQTATGLITDVTATRSHRFFGAQGDVITVDYQFVRGQRFYGGVQIFNGDGLALATTADVPTAAGDARLTITIPVTGEYSVFVANPQTDYEGAGVYQVSLILNATEQESTLATPTATPVEPTPLPTLTDGLITESFISADRLQNSYSFTALAGDRITAAVDVQVDSSLIPAIELYDPDRRMIARVQAAASGLSLTLPTYIIQRGGQYILTITGALGLQDRGIGLYSLQFEQTPGIVVGSTSIRFGSPVIGRLSDNSILRYTFNATEGDLIRVSTVNVSGDLNPRLTVLSPDGSYLTGATDQYESVPDSKDAVTPLTTIRQNGPHTILVSRYGLRAGGSSGNFELRLENLTAVAIETRPSGIAPLVLQPDRVYDVVLTPDQPEVRYTIYGDNSSQEVSQPETVTFSLRVSYPSGDLPLRVTIEDSNGDVIATGRETASEIRIDAVRLFTRLEYTVVLERAPGSGTPFTPIRVVESVRN